MKAPNEPDVDIFVRQLVPGEVKKTARRSSLRVTWRTSPETLTILPATGGTLLKSRILTDSWMTLMEIHHSFKISNRFYLTRFFQKTFRICYVWNSQTVISYLSYLYQAVVVVYFSWVLVCSCYFHRDASQLVILAMSQLKNIVLPTLFVIKIRLIIDIMTENQQFLLVLPKKRRKKMLNWQTQTDIPLKPWAFMLAVFIKRNSFMRSPSKNKSAAFFRIEKTLNSSFEYSVN